MVEESVVQNVNSPPSSEELKPIWGCRAIAGRIGKSERQTYHLLEKGLLPARKLGKEWFTTENALRRHFAVSGEAA